MEIIIRCDSFYGKDTTKIRKKNRKIDFEEIH